MTTLTAAELDQILKNAGLSKTVYAYVMPETEQVIDGIMGNTGSPERAAFHDMYTAAWTKKQDAMHLDFFKTWHEWTSDVVTLGDGYKYEYPTAGASEPIREAIYQYGLHTLQQGLKPVIHIFAGEYEGYKAYADAAGIQVVEHDRNHWWDTLDKIEGHHQFYLSHPSAIDGNIWPEYDSFMHRLSEHNPAAKVMLDLTYVGCVARDFHINADYENIEQICFSLSKPFGLYYHRIGGVLSRTESKGLFGNQWFKNLLSLKIGTEMMKHFDVHELARRYQPVQAQTLTQAAEVLGGEVKAADIFLLGTIDIPADPKPIHQYLRRHATHGFARICLTPTIAHIVNPEISPDVHVRYYEQLQLEPNRGAVMP